MKYRKRPVVIDAVRYTGTPSSYAECMMFLQDSGRGCNSAPNGDIKIHTLEGMMTCKPGDWIIRGIKGEFYPCKSDIFEATYEPAQ